ncbi:Toll-like receptor 4 [Elysia marginata]|uniref:Toll-like receptor 4 n=1 Tax=Elysia marginata TaxID=1093978 RepID=A0AAV4HYE2_9GAST|nr:Toll-like receptor 4 [Elysia marginata]
MVSPQPPKHRELTYHLFSLDENLTDRGPISKTRSDSNSEGLANRNAGIYIGLFQPETEKVLQKPETRTYKSGLSASSSASRQIERSMSEQNAISNQLKLLDNRTRRHTEVVPRHDQTGTGCDQSHRDFDLEARFETTGCPPTCRCSSRYGNVIDVVDCSNKGFTNVPALPVSAREVNLQGNFIQQVSCDAFGHLRRLRKLNLSVNTIRVLRNCSFASLTALEKLTLAENQMVSFPGDVFRCLQNLLALDLAQNKINALTQDMFQHLTNLSSLNLGGNSLTKLKDHTFQGLSSLAYLSLRGNSLRYLPGTFETQAFGGLESLESLHLEGNQPDFPESFTYPDQPLAQVPSLRSLSLDGYPRQLGPGFSALQNLTHLTFVGIDGGFCSMNSDIPPHFFDHLATVQPLHINMSYCSFQFIPPELFKTLRTIHTLDLFHNDELTIRGFERASKGLENSTLTVLNITDIDKPVASYSSIDETSFQYLKHTQLKVLIFDHCRIIKIAPQAMFDLPETLEFMSFRNNKLIDASGIVGIVHLINLKVIAFSKQLHSNVEKDLSFRRPNSPSKDNIDGSLQLTVPGGVISKRKAHVQTQEETSPHVSASKTEFLSSNLTDNLHMKNTRTRGYCGSTLHTDFYVLMPAKLEEYFDLSKNFCVKLNPIFFSETPALRTLLLYENRLGQSLSEDTRCQTFSNLTSLQVLDISSNVIEDLPELMFEKNPNLEILNLSNNQMSTFRPSLAKNKKLEMLDLASNRLTGFSQQTCEQLLSIKRYSPRFKTRISKNHDFLCDCDNIFFLQFLLDHQEIFEDVKTSFQCRLANGSHIGYDRLALILPRLGVGCIAQPLFVAVLTAFFLLTASLAVCAIYHFKRWQWKYLYYLSKSRLHIGSTYLQYSYVAHAFLTYDQESRRLRGMMRDVFRHRLRELGITTVLGEVDFRAGPREASIASAITGTRKTLVFLSPDIFQDYYRQLEVNLAIMHELHLRRPVLVPVLLLREELLTWRGRIPDDSQQLGPSSAIAETRPDKFRDGVPAARRTQSTDRRNRTRDLDDLTRFQHMLTNFPPEISTFLRGQIHRCLVYVGDTDDFWQHLKSVILDGETV